MVDQEKDSENPAPDNDGTSEKNPRIFLFRIRNLVIYAVILLVIGGGVEGWLYFKKHKKTVKEAPVSTEAAKPPVKTSADFFDHIVVFGPYEIPLKGTKQSHEGDVVQEGVTAPPGNPESAPTDAMKDNSDAAKSGGDGEIKDAPDQAGKETGTDAASGVNILKITIALELDTPQLSQETTTKTSMIESDIKEFFQNKTVQDLDTEEGKITVKNELIANLNKMLDSGKVRDIYFTVYLII